MLTLADLAQAVEAYKHEEVSLDEFLDWYRRASRTKFAASAPALQAALQIDAAIARLDYEADYSEQQLLEELENTLRPFAPRWQRVADDLFVLREGGKPAIQTVASGTTKVLIRKAPASEIPVAASKPSAMTHPLEFEAVPA